MLAGIYYGNNLSGMTVISLMDEYRNVHFYCSSSENSPDSFILSFFDHYTVSRIYILPHESNLKKGDGSKNGNSIISTEFLNPGNLDKTQLSSSFLDEIVSRTDLLKRKLSELGIEVYQLSQKSNTNYTDGLENCDLYSFCQNISERFDLEIDPGLIDSDQHLKACRALVAGLKHENQDFAIYGNSEEGLIVS